ncbi:uncharacterized protein [Littorina saxatilis]|uniref:Uncharacterized protein n=1 Tax=Littorina saxatilis TaxID=31220 RepID=A0AAN9BR33_9CAEN
MLYVLLPFLLVASTLSQSTKNCEKYEAELQSRPDFTHKVVTSSLPLPPDYVITSVEPDLSKGRSFYWCEMKVNDGDGEIKTLRRFGHNDTHWWVTKGCGGWFTIKACRNDSTTPSNNKSVDPHTTPTIIDKTPAPSEKRGSQAGTKKPLEYSDLNSSALMSLISWLREQDQGGYNAIEEKVGPSPHSRVLRSVDEELALEFGF